MDSKIKKDLCSLLERKVNEVIMGGDISADDMHCVKEAMQTMYYADVIEAMKSNPSQVYLDSSYDSGMMVPMDMDSHRRGRSAMTGRYVSRDGYGNRRSGHSIHDRMVDNLERMMDEASSQYERDEIARTIRNIEMDK